MPETRKPQLQAGAVPYRRMGSSVEFCVISSQSVGGWGFPKGGVDGGETVEQAAVRESLEEAGIRGRVEGDLGSYDYIKVDQPCTVWMVLLKVEQIYEQWPEVDCRHRRWVIGPTARQLITHQGLRRILETAIERLTAPPPQRNPETH